MVEKNTHIFQRSTVAPSEAGLSASQHSVSPGSLLRPPGIHYGWNPLRLQALYHFAYTLGTESVSRFCRFHPEMDESIHILHEILQGMTNSPLLCYDTIPTAFPSPLPP